MLQGLISSIARPLVLRYIINEVSFILTGSIELARNNRTIVTFSVQLGSAPLQPVCGDYCLTD